MFGFRWKDWSDFKSARASEAPAIGDQVLGVADGTLRDFDLIKTYRSGDITYARPIRKPVLGSVVVGVDGVALTEGAEFTLDSTTGRITLAAAPAPGAEVTAGYEFDVPVRFDTDQIQTSVASFKAGQVPNVPIIEVRV